MKSIMFILGAVLTSGAVLCAQEVPAPRYEVGLNYSWLHVNSANFDFQRTGNGGSGYFEYNLNSMIGLVISAVMQTHEQVLMTRRSRICLDRGLTGGIHA
jgi:hypothetical protein